MNSFFVQRQFSYPNKMNTKKYGCAMLAGGSGKRMGHRNKAELEYNDASFAERISDELIKTGSRCYLSTAAYDQKLPENWMLVKDTVFSDDGSFGGPMAGICSCLKQAQFDGLKGLFFVPCDAPYFDKREIEMLEKHVDPDTDAVCWQTADGKIQTTFGWYSTDCITAFEEDIQAGKLKILRTMERLRLKVIDTSACGIDDRVFTNVNTPEDYEMLQREKKHILICGQRGAGKTTLISRIMSETSLSVHGYKTAVDSIDNDGVKTICMYPVRSNKRTKTKGAIIGHTQNKVIDVKYDTFDGLGVSLVEKRDENGILIMDEIGFMEIGSDRFCREVIKAFDEGSHIIAAIKAEDHGYKYLRMIKEHPYVKVFDLNEDNRQEIYASVREIVNGWEKRRQKGDGLS